MSERMVSERDWRKLERITESAEADANRLAGELKAMVEWIDMRDSGREPHPRVIAAREALDKHKETKE